MYEGFLHLSAQKNRIFSKKNNIIMYLLENKHFNTSFLNEIHLEKCSGDITCVLLKYFTNIFFFDFYFYFITRTSYYFPEPTESKVEEVFVRFQMTSVNYVRHVEYD